MCSLCSKIDCTYSNLYSQNYFKKLHVFKDQHFYTHKKYQNGSIGKVPPVFFINGI